MSLAKRILVNSIIRATAKRILSISPVSVKSSAIGTRKLEQLAMRSSLVKKIDYTEAEYKGVKGEFQRKKEGGRDDAMVLYSHGGAFIMGSPKSHRDLTGRIVLKTGISCLSIDYPLAPTHIFPSQLDDVVVAYTWLLEKGYAPERIALGGDSAGGNIAMAAMLSIIEKKLPVPGAAFFLSPVTDLAATGNSIKKNSWKDPMIPARRFPELKDIYAPGFDPYLPLVSPLYGDFSQFPPVYLTAGSTEILLDDTLRVADKMKANNIDVTCVIRKAMPHVYPSLAGFLPEGKEAIREISDFLTRTIGK